MGERRWRPFLARRGRLFFRKIFSVRRAAILSVVLEWPLTGNIMIGQGKYRVENLFLWFFLMSFVKIIKFTKQKVCQNYESSVCYGRGRWWFPPSRKTVQSSLAGKVLFIEGFWRIKGWMDSSSYGELCFKAYCNQKSTLSKFNQDSCSVVLDSRIEKLLLRKQTNTHTLTIRNYWN